MAIISNSVNVGTTATLLASGPSSASATNRVTVNLRQTSSNAYLGGSGVSNTSLTVPVGIPLVFVLHKDEDLYAVGAAANNFFDVLQTGA